MEMRYSEIVEVYEKLGATSGRLEKESIIAVFLKKLKKEGKSEWIYLLRGRVLPDYDSREMGISRQLAIKAICSSYGVSLASVEGKFRKIGDIGEIAEEISTKKKQSTLFSSHLTIAKVFENLQKIMNIEGKGTVDKKIGLISELLSMANAKESKYILRTLLSDLRIGVADGTLRDSIAEACFPDKKSEMSPKIQESYDMTGDFAFVFQSAMKGEKELEKTELVLGRPMNVMLPVKVTEISDAFKIVGKPCALEHKYDGFRMIISRNLREIKLFTRRLEEVTKQFPDVVEAVRKHVKGEKFLLDSEVVGYDSKTGKYTPFEAISQRIKRKYDVEKLIAKLPVEINVFDIMYYGNESVMDKPFRERRKIIEKIVNSKDKVIRTSAQIVTSDEKEAEKFYANALKIGEEGVMFKKIDAPYRAGRRVGYIVKLKPEVNDLDLVITGAEYGSGKRGGLLTSYYVACRAGEKFVEVGKVSSGLKELESEQEGAITYDEMSKLLKPLITDEKGSYVKTKAKIVVSVKYQNIQKSPSYSSGYAMRFPRITHYRPDRNTSDLATLKDIERESKRK